jgi:DNA-binding MarR family transcriptional regulator
MIRLTGTDKYTLKPDELALLYAKRAAIKANLLTGQERRVLEWIIEKKPAIESEDVAGLLDVSAQHASGLLLRLFKKDYLQRGTVPDPTGGIKHVYSLRDNMREPLAALGYYIARRSRWNADGKLISD